MDGASLGADPRSFRFRAIKPITGEEMDPTFACASTPLVDAAIIAAANAFNSAPGPTAAARAALLGSIAAELEVIHEPLLIRAVAETAYSHQRLDREFQRTTSTLRMFAHQITNGDWPRTAIDTAQAPADLSLPTMPDVRRTHVPLGPVAVFGASNFPLAYGVAGGDTASALAAGCPVIAKGHPAHPGTGELIARAIARVLERSSIDPGYFSFLHSGGDHERNVGRDILGNPEIKAVGFTGSFAGGMALCDMVTSRDEPIPVFAEMGSVNPVFILTGALENSEDIADRLAASILDSAGQQCTCPGLIFVQTSEKGASSPGSLFIGALRKRFEGVRAMPMLSHRTAENYRARTSAVGAATGNKRGGQPNAAGSRTTPKSSTRPAAPPLGEPELFQVTSQEFRANGTLREEIFGPAAVVVTCSSAAELLDAAHTVPGSLTGAIFAGSREAELARRLGAVLQRRVGRLIYNGVPTGVRVCEAMVHGGPYPATNRPDTTAVGPNAITRWTRPVCFQNTPDELLPPELQNSNPLRLRRRVNGVITDRALTGR
jgi:NADP-dependent aldehyde dehydrogenase